MVDKIPDNNQNWLDFTKKKLDTPQIENNTTPTVHIGGEVKPDLDKGVKIEKNGDAAQLPNANDAWGLNLSDEEKAAIKAQQDASGEIKEPQSGFKRVVNNVLHSETTKDIGTAAAVGTVGAILGFLKPLAAGFIGLLGATSCARDLNEPDVSAGAGVTVEIDDEYRHNHAIEQLNQDAPEGGYRTDEGIKYEYKYDPYLQKPYVEFENGFKHYINEKTAVEPNSATAALRDVFKTIGIDVPDENTKVLTDVTTDVSSFSGKPGLSMSIVRSHFVPADLKEIAAGTPKVQFGVRDLNIEGNLEKIDETGRFNLEANGNGTVNSPGGLYIAGEDGREIYMQYQKDFYLGTTEPHDNDPEQVKDCLVVYVKEKGENTFKEAYALRANPDDPSNIMIGQINREQGTNFEFHTDNVETFNADVTDIDKIYEDAFNNINIEVNTETEVDITVK